jgi:hypothetical protein
MPKGSLDLLGVLLRVANSTGINGNFLKNNCSKSQTLEIT